MQLRALNFSVWLFLVIQTGHSLVTDFEEEYKLFIEHAACPIPAENLHFSIIKTQIRNARVLSTMAAKYRQLKQAIEELDSTKKNYELLQMEHREEMNSLENLKKEHGKEISELKSKITKEISELKWNNSKEISKLKSDHRQEVHSFENTLRLERNATASLQAELTRLRNRLPGKKMQETVLNINNCALENVKTDKSQALYEASGNGNLAEVKKLLMDCQDPNALWEYPTYNTNGDSPLIFAAAEGHLNIVSILIKYGADVNHENIFGFTTLMCASMAGFHEVVELLLENGAKINEQDRDRRTAIWWAARYEHVNVTNVLINAKADINIKCNEGRTPLLAAIYSYISKEREMVKIVKLLLKNGAKINEQDNEGKTAIWWAAFNVRVDIMKVLLKNKADANIKDHEGKSPIEVVGKHRNADKSKIPEAIRLLKSATSFHNFF